MRLVWLFLCVLNYVRAGFILRYVEQLANGASLCNDGSGVYFIGGWVNVKLTTKGIKFYTMTTPTENNAITYVDVSSSEPATDKCIKASSWAFIMKSYTPNGSGCNRLHFYINYEGLGNAETCPGTTYSFEDVFATGSSTPTTFTLASLKTDVRYYRAVYAYGSSLSSSTLQDTRGFALEMSLGIEGSYYSLRPSFFTTTYYRSNTTMSPYFLNSLEGNRGMISVLNSNDYWQGGVTLKSSSNKYIRNLISLVPYYRPHGLAFSILMTVQMSISSTDSTTMELVIETGSTSNFTYTLKLNPNSGSPTVVQSFNVDSTSTDTFASTTQSSLTTYEYHIALNFYNASSTRTYVRAMVTGTSMGARLRESYSTSAFSFANKWINMTVGMATAGIGIKIVDIQVGEAAVNWAGWTVDSNTADMKVGGYRSSDTSNFVSSNIIRCASGSYKNTSTLVCDACPTNCATCEGDTNVVFCTSCNSGKYYNVKEGTCLDSCDKTENYFKQDSSPLICSNCFVEFCKTCSALGTCSEYMSSTAIKLKEYNIDYPNKKITFRFDHILNFSNPSSYLTYEFIDSNYTSITTSTYRDALVSGITWTIKGYDLSVQFNTIDTINCSKTKLSLKSSQLPLLFYSSSSITSLSSSFEIPFSNFLNPSTSTWSTIGKYSNYVFKVFLILSILFISQSLDSYFIILSYVYFFRMMNIAYPADFNAFLDGFLENLNWPLGNYILYFIPGTKCGTLPMKVKQTYFDCVSLRNIQLFLFLTVYLTTVKLICMFLRCCVIKQKGKPKGCFTNAVKRADMKISKSYFIRFFSASIGFFSMYSCLGIMNDINNGSSMSIHSIVLNGVMGISTVFLLVLIFVMTKYSRKVIDLPQEEFLKKIYHPLFLKILDIDFKQEKKAYYFFFARHVKIFIFGVASYSLYYIPIAQISVMLGVEGLYFFWLILLRPYRNYLKLLIEFLIHLTIILIICLAFFTHPELQIVPYSIFKTFGTVMTILLFILLIMISLMILIEIIIATYAAYKIHKANRSKVEPKAVKPVIDD